jgi:hypothetical protein
MPRRPANVNQADTQRVIRAFKRESVAFRLTLQPNGAAIFELASIVAPEPNASDVSPLLPRADGA